MKKKILKKKYHQVCGDDRHDQRQKYHCVPQFPAGAPSEREGRKEGGREGLEFVIWGV